MRSAMSQALVNAGFAKTTDKRGLFAASWNAHLSYRTYKSCEAQGIPGNPYEASALQAKKAG